MILSCLCTRDLLQCREVNRHWHVLASSICRSQFLPLPIFKTIINMKGNWKPLYTTFHNFENLPWSACLLYISTLHRVDGKFLKMELDEKRVTVAAVAKFFRNFGPHIHELTLQLDDMVGYQQSWTGFAFILNGISNVVHLDMSYINMDGPIQGDLNVNFQKLKCFITSINNCHTFHLFKVIRMSATNLRSLDIRVQQPRIAGDYLVHCSKELGSLLQGIPLLRLEFELGVSNTILNDIMSGAGGPLLLIQLSIYVEPSTDNSNHAPLERFLTNTAKTLQKLVIHDFSSSPDSGTARLRIPNLPNLTHLKIIYSRYSSWVQPLLFFVTPFTMDQFPKLVKVSVRDNSQCTGGLTPFALCHYDTVTHLTVCDGDLRVRNPMRTDWTRIFPSLKKLKANLTKDGLREVLANYQNLEHLSINLWGEQHEDSVLDFMLCGIPGIESINWKDFDLSQLTTLREISATPSLLDFTRLQTLKVVGWNSNRASYDALAHCCFLQIQPLTSLVLSNIPISDEVKSKLSGRHQNLEMYQTWSRRRKESKFKKFQ